MFQKTAELETPQIYHHLVHGVVPRPIAWVSTLSKEGISNLAPYSFFSVASVNPPVLTVTAVPARDKLEKDTLTNLLETKECVVNVVTEDVLEIMNESCADFAHNQSEIDALNIETIASEMIQPAGIKAAKVRFECTLRETIDIAKHPAGGVLILLDVVGIHIDDSVADGAQINGKTLKALGKLGGNDYSTVNEQITLARPSAPKTSA